MDEFNTALREWISFHSGLGVNLESSLNAGADAAALEHFETNVGFEVVDEFKALYRFADGQLNLYTQALDTSIPWAPMFGYYRLMSLDEALERYRFWQELYVDDDGNFRQPDYPWEVRENDPVEPLYWHPSRIPFASDDVGNDLAIDLAPASGGAIGQVIQYGADFFDVKVLAPAISKLMLLAIERLDLQEPGRVSEKPAARASQYHPPLPVHISFEIDWRETPPVPYEPSAAELSEAAAEEALEQAARTAFLVWLTDQHIDSEQAQSYLNLLDRCFDDAVSPSKSFMPANLSPDDAFRFYLAGMDTELYGQHFTTDERSLMLDARRLLHHYRVDTGEWTEHQRERAELVRQRKRQAIDAYENLEMQRDGFGPLIINGQPVEGSEIE